MIIYFFLLGIISIISQAIIFRELINTFYGNEFFSSLIFGFWLIWVGIGSHLFAKFLKPSKKIIIFTFLLIPLLLFFEIFILRFSQKFISLPEEAPNLIYAIIIALFLSSPVCLLLGIFWAKSTQLFSEEEEIKSTLNWAYFFETIGFIFGGLLFSFLVYLPPFQIIYLILFFSLILLSFSLSDFKKKIFILLLLLLSLILIPYLKILEKKTLFFKFKNQNLITFENSPYGKIILTKTDDQFNFYENGMFLGSNHDIESAEEITHLALLSHPSPKKVLLIANGFSGILKEILKHQVNELYFLEFDPKILEISKKYLKEFEELNFEKKLKIFSEDPIYFLKKNRDSFDLILLNISTPSTILTNRFFTQEFFQSIKRNLKEDGILFFYLPYSPSGANKNLESLNSSILKTAKKTFEDVSILPGENNFFLCKNSLLDISPEILIKRKNERKIETKFLNDAYIYYRFYFTDQKRLLNSLATNRAKINQNFHPIAYFYQILYWLDSSSPKISKIFEEISFSFWQIFIILSLFLTLFFLERRKKIKKYLPILSIFINGFSLMTLETILIFFYQVFIGYIYSKITLIISALMTGMALGIYFGNKKEKIAIFLPHLFLSIFLILLPFPFTILNKINLFFAENLFFALAILVGFWGGVIFPISNKIYLSFQEKPKEKTGLIYAWDLFGSFFGAILPNLILIPVYGLKTTLIFLALLNFFIFLFAKNLGSKNI